MKLFRLCAAFSLIPSALMAGSPVAVARPGEISEYYVSVTGVWSYVRPLVFQTAHSVVWRDGWLYAGVTGAAASILRINPADAAVTVLASRGIDTPGWSLSDPQGTEFGPDGKLYFCTAFGTPAGEGVFRVNVDGTGFEQFLTKAGGVAPGNWDLNNARDLVWNNNDLIVSSRSGFSTANRPIYRFRDSDANGSWDAVVNLVGTGVTAPQGLLVDAAILYGVNTAGRVFSLDPLATPPAAVGTVATIAGQNLMDLGKVEGKRYILSNGGSLYRLNDDNTTVVVATGLGAASDFVAYPEADSENGNAGDGLGDTWERLYFGDLAQLPGTDSDNDQFSNLVEFQNGSNPADPTSVPTDSDADGMRDSWELTYFANLLQKAEDDFDKDGSPNLDEFTLGTNPADPVSQPDTDQDGLPDGTERRWFGSLAEDKDGDFDLDTFKNLAELTAGSNPIRAGNTPDNVNTVYHVALATSAGLRHYTVAKRIWTDVGPVTVKSYQSVVAVSGVLYGSSLGEIDRINADTGDVLTLATRGTGAAGAAGWLSSDAQGVEAGPDGMLYFSTAFGPARGEGVFRLTPHGNGFESFIPRTGGDWILDHARDLAWQGGNLYVSARGDFAAVGRPVYVFGGTGTWLHTLTDSMAAPQGLHFDGNRLLVARAGGGVAVLDSTAAPPVAPETIRPLTGVLMDALTIAGEVYVVSFANGVSYDNGMAYATALPAEAGITLSDAVVYTPGSNPDTDGDGLVDAWEISHFGGITVETGNGDPDGDGSVNLVEQALGLNPKDGSQAFRVSLTGLAAAGPVLTWPSANGISFRIRSSPDLQDWSVLEATVTGGSPTASWTAPPGSPGRRFYRVDFAP